VVREGVPAFAGMTEKRLVLRLANTAFAGMTEKMLVVREASEIKKM
jgi:hypothetical protein